MKKNIFKGNQSAQQVSPNIDDYMSTVPDDASKSGYLYFPFVASDLLDQSLGLNLLRHLKGKKLYPLIAANLEVMNEMEKLRAEKIIKLIAQINDISDNLQMVDTKLKKGSGWNIQSLVNAVSEDIFHPLIKNTATISQQLSVLRKMVCVYSRLNHLSAERDKLYILGHGGAGMKMLAADEMMAQGYIKAKKLANQLIKNGLPKSFIDLRITACYSADSVKPTSFSQDELAETSGLFSQKRGMFRRLFNAPKDILPIAQLISKELKLQGYRNIQVTGYHGAGVTFSQTEYRSRRIEGEPDIRRSLVKRIF